MTSKKFELEPLTLPYYILREASGGSSLYHLTETLQISKQRLHYWLSRFKKEEWITQPFHGFYELTDKGHTILEWCSAKSKKNLVRLENMRYKYPIYDGLDALIKKRRWEKIQPLNNMKVYHTKYESHHIKLFAGSKNPCLEITCRQRTGDDIYEMMYEARQLGESIIKQYVEDLEVQLGIGTPSMQPEWAIPSPLAEVLLEKTCSSQVKTANGVLNRSKGRNADIETRDIRLANKIFNLPLLVEDISHDIKTLKSGGYSNWLIL